MNKKCSLSLLIMMLTVFKAISQNRTGFPYENPNDNRSISEYLEKKLGSTPKIRELLETECEQSFFFVEFSFKRNGHFNKIVPSYDANMVIYRIAKLYIEETETHWKINKKWAKKTFLLPIIYSANCPEGEKPSIDDLFADLFVLQNFQHAPDFRPRIGTINSYKEAILIPPVLLRGFYF